MAAEYGFVYFLSNESMPGLFKVGFSEKHPKVRALELSKSTGCPTPFEVMTYFGCTNPMTVERYLHKSLAKYRINDKREFFQLEEIQIHEEILSVGEYFEIDECNLSYDRVDALYALYIHQRKSEKQWKIDYFNNQCADASDMNFKKFGFK